MRRARRCRTDAKPHCDQGESPEREDFPQHPDPLLLEPHILESFCGAAVEPRRRYYITTARGEIALRRPRDRCMTGRRELREARLRLAKNVFRLVEPPLLHERAAEDDLRVADLVREVFAAVEQL